MSWIANIRGWLRGLRHTRGAEAPEPGSADQLTYLLHWSGAAGRYLCRVQELPEVGADGASLAECLEAGRSAARGALERRARDGAVAPKPSPPRLGEPQPPEGSSFETRFRVRIGPPGAP